MRLPSIPAIVYSIANCAPPAPVMGINLLVLFSKRFYRDRTTTLATLGCFLVSLPFLAVHLLNGVDVKSYLISYCAALFIFASTIYAAKYVYQQGPSKYIKQSCLLIFLTFSISSTALLVSGTPDFLHGWYAHYYTSNLTILRYGGYMYEASHLCLLAAPLLIYLISTETPINNRLLYILALLVPLIATRSIGFFSTFTVSFLITGISNFDDKRKTKRYFTILSLTLLTLLATYLLSDSIRERTERIISLSDSSTNGRTVDSYALATSIAEKKNLYLGVGIGQIKIIGKSIIKDYYQYSDEVETVRIPSSAAEMLASFGILGLSLKIVTLIYLYQKNRIYRNTFANRLFIFMFIYQFYGSFMISTMELFCFALSIFSAKNHQPVAKNTHDNEISRLRPLIQRPQW